MNHAQKIKMARKMITPKEIKNRVSIWNSKQWNIRKSLKKRKQNPPTAPQKRPSDSLFRKLLG